MSLFAKVCHGRFHDILPKELYDNEYTSFIDIYFYEFS